MHEWTLLLTERFYDLVLSQQKRILVQAPDHAVPGMEYNHAKVGDIAIVRAEGRRDLRCRIKRVVHYKTPEELLVYEDIRLVSPDAHSIKEAANELYGRPDYHRRVPLYGIVAMEVGDPA